MLVKLWLMIFSIYIKQPTDFPVFLQHPSKISNNWGWFELANHNPTDLKVRDDRIVFFWTNRFNRIWNATANLRWLMNAWWCNNHLEKYVSQLGWLLLMYGKIKVMFQTTNQTILFTNTLTRALILWKIKNVWNHINVALSESGVPLNPRLHHHFPLIHISTCHWGRPQFQSTSSPTNTPKKPGTWRCRFVMGPRSSKSWMTWQKSIETYDDWGSPMT